MCNWDTSQVLIYGNFMDEGRETFSTEEEETRGEGITLSDPLGWFDISISNTIYKNWIWDWGDTFHNQIYPPSTEAHSFHHTFNETPFHPIESLTHV